MDFRKYNIEDFAANESFIEWVYKSDSNSVRFWDLYISENPEIRLKAEQARTLILNLNRAQQTRPDPDVVSSLWDKIDLRTKTLPQRPVKSMVNSAVRVAMATAAILIVGLAIGFLVQKTSVKKQDFYVYQNSVTDYAEQINETGKALELKLPDGSTVTLDNKSRLKYKVNYANDTTRDVYLLGNAFFNVVKNPDKPFIVHSNEVLTKVLGTSFTVEAPENGESIVVSVKTGKVSVYTEKENIELTDSEKKVILLPNQQVKFVRAAQLFNKSLVDVPEILNPHITDEDFKFENAPISDVFETLENAYGIDIVFNVEAMKRCFLTAPLGSEPLLEKMEIICKTIGATYKIVDAKVVVRSSGC